MTGNCFSVISFNTGIQHFCEFAFFKTGDVRFSLNLSKKYIAVCKGILMACISISVKSFSVEKNLYLMSVKYKYKIEKN